MALQEKKYISINTKATRGIIGFAQNEKIILGDWEIETENQFAVILATVLSGKGDLATAEKILITAVARARNSGMDYEYTGQKTMLKSKGDMPLLMEPVKATISIYNSRDYEVILLNHDGHLTGSKIPVTGSSFEINGARDKTLYYLITRK